MSLDYRDPEWLSETLGLDRNTIYKFLQDGTLPAVQLGRKWLISESRLRTWLEQQTERQTRSRLAVARMTERTVRRMENLADDAREVVRLALGEARRYGHGYLGQEHLLLGLTAAASPAGKLLHTNGLTTERIRQEIEARVDRGPATSSADDADTPLPPKLGRTPRARQAMQLAAAEAKTAKRKLVTATDLLVGLLLTGGGIGHEILTASAMNVEMVRQTFKKDTL